MDEKLFNIDNSNIIQDNENYYFFRALNVEDNKDIENGINTNENGKIEKIRTDRERYEKKAKYSKDSQISLEEIYDHIKIHSKKE